MKMALVEFPKKCRSNAGQRPIPSAPAYRHTVQFHPSPFSYQALLFNFMRVWFPDKAWSSNATIYWEAGVCLILQVINIPFHKVTGYFLWEEWEEENKEHSWVEHFTSLPKKGVGALLSVVTFSHERTPMWCCLRALEANSWTNDNATTTGVEIESWQQTNMQII